MEEKESIKKSNSSEGERKNLNVKVNNQDECKYCKSALVKEDSSLGF